MKKQFIVKATLCAVANVCVSVSAAAEVGAKIETIDVIGQANHVELSVELSPESTTSADFRDQLTQLPGVSVNGNGPLSAIPQYRGMFGDRILIKIDGAPMLGAGPNAMDPPLSHVIPKANSQILLYRGIAPVSFGTEALSGAISVTSDIDSQFSQFAGFSSSFSAQYQDQGDAEHYVTGLSYADNSTFISLTAIDQTRDSVEDGRGIAVPNSHYTRDGAALQAGWRSDRHLLHGSMQQMDTGATGTPSLAMDIEFIEAEWYRLNYRYLTQSDATVHLKVYGNDNSHAMNNYENRTVASPMMARRNEVENEFLGIELSRSESLSLGSIEAGVSLQQAQHQSVITNPNVAMFFIHNLQNVERDKTSAYVQWQRDLANLSVNLGGRVTRVEMDADDVSSSMAMMNPNVATLVNNFNQAQRKQSFNLIDLTLHTSGKLDGNWYWQASAGQKNRAPSYTEMYVWLPLGISAGLADGNNYLGNLDLKKERSRQVDFGVSYESAWLRLSPRLFYQKVDDFVVGDLSTNSAANMVSMMMSGKTPLQWQNVDAKFWGMDVMLRAKLTEGLALDMNAEWVRATREDINEPLYRIAPASLTSRLVWKGTDLNIALEWLLVNGQNQVSTLQYESPTTGYGIINVHADYQIHDNVSLSVSLSNALDKAYQTHLGGVNRVSGQELAVGEKLFETGRNLTANLVIQF